MSAGVGPTTQLEPEPAVTGVGEYVGFWKRVLAYFINAMALLVVIGPILAIGFDADTMQPSTLGQLFNYLLPPVYFIAMWTNKQTDLGKMVISARIVDAETGAAPSGFRCALRYVGIIIASIPLGLGLLWVAFDTRKQGWHDKIAGTVVVSNR